MIENNLLKTNFTGKDGFRWWIGQVAPEDAQGSQIQEIGEAWGTRVKVRIFGYHPPDETELANDDLPWAQVLLSPQCGSGKANRGKSLRVSPGDTVMGFFLDGDDAQLPVVMGLFAKSGNPAFGGNEDYTFPFNCISPVSIFSKPAIVLKIVVLPIPDGPRRHIISPSFSMAKDTLATFVLPPTLKSTFFTSKKFLLIVFS